jgi:hypothetical protein
VWPTIAAAVFIVCSLATLFAAASAAPGSPLYALRRWEQGVNVTLASGPAGRARLHLRYAVDALAAMNASLTRQAGDNAYRDALSSFQDEMRAAAAAVSQVPDDATRSDLETQLANVRAQARDQLRSALTVLDWPTRVQTTSVLAQVGGDVPRIAQVAIAPMSQRDAQVWQYTVTGSGFQPGAVIVVDGRQVGVTITVTPTTLIANVHEDDNEAAPHHVGVSNPDGSAAETTTLHSQEGNNHEHDPQGGPSSQNTPTTGSDRSGGGINNLSSTPQDDR